MTADGSWPQLSVVLDVEAIQSRTTSKAHCRQCGLQLGFKEASLEEIPNT